MDVDLHERGVPDAAEAMDLTGLDHQNVTWTGLEFLPVHGVQPAALPDELNFVIRMAVRPRPLSRSSVEKECTDVHVTLVGADELMSAPPEGQVLLANTVHAGVLQSQGGEVRAQSEAGTGAPQSDSSARR